MGYLLNYRNWEKLHESLQSINEMDSNVQTVLTYNTAQLMDDIDTSDEDLRAEKDAVLQKFEEYNILFDDKLDIEEVAWFIANQTAFGRGQSDDPNKVLYKAPEPISVNTAPTDNTKILTHGTILQDKILKPTNVNGESKYEDIIKFMNSYAVWQYLTGNDTGDKSSVVPVGLTATVDTNGSLALALRKNDTSTIALYGTVKTENAQSKQQVNTTVWTVPAEGRDIELRLPGTMFATGEVEIQDSSKLDTAINELNALIADKSNKIKSIIIESSASGDRGVGGVSGYPAGTKAGTYPLGKAYTPKSAQESANAGLAFGRAEAIKAKLGNIAPASVKALIQDGGDAAQYAKIIVTIEKTDKPAQQLSKQDLENILLKKSETKDFKSLNQITRIWLRR
jgi:hypothetical protein